MAPPKLPDLINERNAIDNSFQFVDLEVIGHPTVLLLEPAVDQHLEMVMRGKADLLEIQKKVMSLNPPDMSDHNKEHFRLLKEATSLHCQLHSIKSSFSAATGAASTATGSVVGKTDFRLPRIDLPIFDGNITSWVSFRDMFTTAVDSNTSLSKAQKLTYLKSRVTGEALRQISSILICDANYDIAWNLLNARYHSERELFVATMKRFLSQTSNQPSAASIRSIVDSTKECISSLEKLLLPTNPTSEAILMYHMVERIDFKSKELWEHSLKDAKLPTLQELYAFLEIRARSLASSETSKPSSSYKPHQGKVDDPKRHVRVHHANSSTNCKYCQKSSHPLFKCQSFLEASPSIRHDFVKKNSLCYNCLSLGHSTKNCNNSGTCRTCNQRHHTLIHLQKESRDTATAATSTPPVVSNHIQQQAMSDIPQTLLATAVVRVEDAHGAVHLCRALLDGGSSASFISEECVQRLSLSRKKATPEIRGLSSTPLASCKGMTSITIRPHFTSSSRHQLNPLILNSVTCRLPTTNCSANEWSHLKGLQLADPDFKTPATIDLLLGSDVFWELLQDGKLTGSPGSPLALNSSLGWLVAGAITKPSTIVHVHYADIDLDESIQRFWDLEQVSSQPPQTNEEEFCENHFNSTHQRTSDGRFIVQLPTKSEFNSARIFNSLHSNSDSGETSSQSSSVKLGDSRSSAVRQLMSLERRLAKDPESDEKYKAFMKEYEELGHMELVSQEEIDNPALETYYIPHHWVIKEDSTTTQFRVVFNASFKTSNGKSLNDQLCVGPTIQDNLTRIITRFRRHKVALTADVAKMYRQVLVTPNQQDLQRIVWRESPDVPIRTYRLLTATYGTASAPFLAIRSLHQLANDGALECPQAAQVIREDFYVDDALTGAGSTGQAVQLQSDLQKLLKRGQMELRKWRSNDPDALVHLPDHLKDTSDIQFVDVDPTKKALGLIWNNKSDSYRFLVAYKFKPTKITKRTVLSFTAKLFDPLGWLAPVIIVAKCLIQSLWKLNLT